MTEVYSILNQAAPEADTGFVTGVWVFFGVLFLILCISLLKKVTTNNTSIGRIIGHIFSMAFIIVICVLFGISVWDDKQTYNEYIEAWDSGAYSVEIGEPGRLEIYPFEDEDGKTVYEISFWINGKYFDSDYAYGECYFSKSDLRLIQSSKIFEVKYIVDEYEDNIILSLSVGEKTT